MLTSLQARSFDVHLLATRMFPGSTWVPDQASYAGIHDVSVLPATAIAMLVRKLKLDVLVDVDGWSDGGRPDIFLHRAAPLQLTWLGYPGTTGAPWFDGIVVDQFIVPADQQTAFSEPVVYLPRCYQPVSPPQAVPEPPGRVACGLPAEPGLVYACFNEPAKMGPRSFIRMLDVLARVPASVLWLLEPAGRGADRLRHIASERGVDPNRLIFRPKLSYLSYLGRYRHVDMVLDTETYNGHTVSSDALQMGVPVLTRPGEVMAARVAGSLNHHLGLDDCNVTTDEAFVAQATRFAHDREWRESLRERLGQARHAPGVFDPAGYARDFARLVFELLARKASMPNPPGQGTSRSARSFDHVGTPEP
jgi:predicted O-linked N-acetylglucosamine transferase (SPINDLY family)